MEGEEIVDVSHGTVWFRDLFGFVGISRPDGQWITQTLPEQYLDTLSDPRWREAARRPGHR